MRATVLWQEGHFCCEYHPDSDPPVLSVTKGCDAVFELEVRSELEARERAAALREFLRSQLARADRERVRILRVG